VLFWDESNWQPLCAAHHDSTKQREEKSGKLIGNDTSGEPTHPDHHWNREPCVNGNSVALPMPNTRHTSHENLGDPEDNSFCNDVST
jgi:hypothetical protein